MKTIAMLAIVSTMLLALGGCSMQRGTAPGVSSPDREALSERFMDWERSRGTTSWQRMRDADVERVNAVGLAPAL